MAADAATRRGVSASPPAACPPTPWRSGATAASMPSTSTASTRWPAVPAASPRRPSRPSRRSWLRLGTRRHRGRDPTTATWSTWPRPRGGRHRRRAVGARTPTESDLGAVAGEPDAFAALNRAFAPAPVRIRVAPGSPPGHRWWWCTGSRPTEWPSFPESWSSSTSGRRRLGAGGRGRPGAALVVPVTELDVGAGGPPVAICISSCSAPRPGRSACKPAGWPGTPRSCPRPSPSAATTPGCAPTRRWTARAPTGGCWPCTSAPTTRCTTSAPCSTIRRPEDPVRPALQGRGRQLGPLRVQRPDPGREGRRRAPTPCRPTATWCCTRGPTPTRCPTWRSRTTTSAAATPRPSGPIAEDQQFYLESRGVPPDVADRLIALGFLDEVLEQLPVPALADTAPLAAGCQARRGRLPRQAGVRPGGALMAELGRIRRRQGGARDAPCGSTAAPTASAWSASATTSTPSATGAVTPTTRCRRATSTSRSAGSSAGSTAAPSRCIDGQPQSLPATQPVPVYEVHRDGDDVVVTDGDRRMSAAIASWSSRTCTPRSAGREILRGVDLQVRSGRGPRRDGPERLGQEHPLARADGPARATRSPAGRVTLDGVDLLESADVEAGPGRAVPGHAVPDRGARGVPGRTRWPRRCGPAGATRPRCRRWSAPRRPGSGSRRGSCPGRSTSTSPAASASATRRSSSGVLRPEFAILDEIDSGLDVDALRAVARRVEAATTETGLGVLAITHYTRLLSELRPDSHPRAVRGSHRAPAAARAGRRARAHRLRRLGRGGGARGTAGQARDAFADPAP